MRFRVLICTVMAALLVTAAAATAATAAPPTGGNTVAVPVTGTSTAGAFAGVFTLTGFAVQNGQVVAVGTLTGTVTDALGNIVAVVNQTVSSAVTATGTCSILDLTIGAIHLDLLGLVVDTNVINIDIVAQSGPGKLLGNLLCAVSHLLDGGASANAIANLLNGILGALG